MTWTTTTPSVPGTYWIFLPHRTRDRVEATRLVRDEDGVLYEESSGYTPTRIRDEVDAQWQGPLVPPPEPDEAERRGQ